MTAISISLSGVTGLDWPRWQRLATEVEFFDFAGLYRYDHFAAPYPTEGPENDSLDLSASLTWLASHTKRIRFGPLVAPFSFRDPHLLARQASAIDDLSGRRFVLGVGAGWMEREHTMFGRELGDIPTRMARFEEGLAVVAGLLRSSEPFGGSIIGTPQEVVMQLRAYTDLGLDELMLHWSVSDDIEGVRLLAEFVLPHFAK